MGVSSHARLSVEFVTRLAALTTRINVWSGGALPVLVTIFGWAALLKGKRPLAPTFSAAR